jgi:hypothetical protein
LIGVIGRCFHNDTERLKKLFEFYARITAAKNSREGAKEIRCLKSSGVSFPRIASSRLRGFASS